MYTFCVLLPTFLTPISAILSGTGPKPGSKVLFPGALPLASAGVGGFINIHYPDLSCVHSNLQNLHRQISQGRAQLLAG